MAFRKPIVSNILLNIVATTATTGSSGPVVLRDSDLNNLVFKVLATSLSATASLDIWIQTSLDGGATFVDCIKFPTISASAANAYWGSASLGGLSVAGLVGASTITSTAGGTGVPLLSNTIQAYWNLGGTTPSASFQVQAIETGVDRGFD